MQETVVNFGPTDNQGTGKLFGILTTPDADKKIAGAPIALILNAGIVHRVGPFRLHVDIARQLAESGYTTMRVDISGLGDSAPRTGEIDGEADRATLDASDAMDHLTETTGVNKFVLLGLCSGAFNAHKVARKDDRIVGSVFLDGIVFPTFGYFVRHKVMRLLRPRFWRNAIKRRLAAASFDEVDAAANTLAEDEFFAGELTQAEVTSDLQGLVERGVQMLFVYTDGYADVCGRSQFKEMYGLEPGDGQIQVEYYPKSEHTFRLIENRRITCDRVTTWFESRFAV